MFVSFFPFVLQDNSVWIAQLIAFKFKTLIYIPKNKYKFEFEASRIIRSKIAAIFVFLLFDL